jgi:hypothetical protein
MYFCFPIARASNAFCAQKLKQILFGGKSRFLAAAQLSETAEGCRALEQLQHYVGYQIPR